MNDSPALRARLQEGLLEHLPVGAGTEAALRAAVQEAVAHPGGLVRSMLAWETGRAAGLTEPVALCLACAVEYFHTASLLFDDLPCMDDALERRGRPCAHRVHGEATAILAALALINRAHLLAGAVLGLLAAERRLAGQLLLDACLGSGGLLEGQARDLGFARAAGDGAAVTRIARLKTVALFELSVLLPALAGGVSPAEWSDLHRLCLYWGLAYQAADDLTDVLGHARASGKTGGRDLARRRPNLALALGTAGAQRRLARQVAQAAATVRRLERHASRWTCLRAYQDRLAGLAAPLARAA